MKHLQPGRGAAFSEHQVVVLWRSEEAGGARPEQEARPGHRPRRIIPVMDPGHTTVAVQRYLDALAEDESAEPIVRALLDRAVRRLHLLCANLLHRSYPRLMRPPLNLQSDEMLGAVVERLLKAMRAVHPRTVRQFFALANQHMRWELNDLARRLDDQPRREELHEGAALAPASSASGLTPNSRRMLEAIDNLPEEEREVFSLVRIQGMTHGEAADILGVSAKTVQRRLNRGLMLLAEGLTDLKPKPLDAGAGPGRQSAP
jgi:RNA polymerase sigma factor (sigma-70 family)